MTVVTGSKIGAAANSNVYLLISGSLRDTNRIQLKHSNNKTPFLRSQTDVFNVILPDPGEIKHINISHDGMDFGSGWHLDKIIIKNKRTEQVLK